MSKQTVPVASIGVVSLGACALTEPASRFPVGGSELQLFLLARWLARRGFDVHLYVADEGQAERTVDGVRVRPLVRLKRGVQIPARMLGAIVLRLARGRHNLYVTRSASAINGLAALAARLAGGRYLHMCAHDFECNGRADASLSRPARWLHHFGMKRANALTCQSHTQQEALRAVFGREGTLVPNLLPDAPAPETGAARKGALWVGRDVEWKQPELFLELALRLPSHEFTMVCQPQPGRVIDRLAGSAPPNLRFVPGLSYVEAARLFAVHRVLVSTSRAEGFQNTILQAIAAGTPVVTLGTDADGMIEARGIGDTCGGDIDMMTTCVERLLADDSRWTQANGQARACCRDWHAAEENLLSLMNHLVN